MRVKKEIKPQKKYERQTVKITNLIDYENRQIGLD